LFAAICAEIVQESTTSKLGKMVRGAGLEPAKALFSVFPASDVNGVLLPFIAQRVSNIILYLQALFGNQWHL
jgi:hypothetical protein